MKKRSAKLSSLPNLPALTTSLSMSQPKMSLLLKVRLSSLSSNILVMATKPDSQRSKHLSKICVMTVNGTMITSLSLPLRTRTQMRSPLRKTRLSRKLQSRQCSSGRWSAARTLCTSHTFLVRKSSSSSRLPSRSCN